MTSNSSTHLASQQSIKAYVDAQVATKDNTDEITEGSTNLYFTNARADDRLQTQSKMKITWHQIVQLMFLHNNLLKIQ